MMCDFEPFFFFLSLCKKIYGEAESWKSFLYLDVNEISWDAFSYVKTKESLNSTLNLLVLSDDYLFPVSGEAGCICVPPFYASVCVCAHIFMSFCYFGERKVSVDSEDKYYFF